MEKNEEAKNNAIKFLNVLRKVKEKKGYEAMMKVLNRVLFELSMRYPSFGEAIDELLKFKVEEEKKKKK